MKFLAGFLLLLICLAAFASATEREAEKHSGAPKEKRGLLGYPVAFAPAVVRPHILPPPAIFAPSFHPPPAVSVSAYGYHQVHPGYAYAYYG